MDEIKEICEKCKKPKIMYRKKYCPRCEKPELKISYYMNLLECLYYIEATSHSGFKQKFWDYLVENYPFTNDTTILIWNDKSSPLIQELFEKLGLNFEEYMNFEISW